jgi:hypothetical protein
LIADVKKYLTSKAVVPRTISSTHSHFPINCGNFSHVTRSSYSPYQSLSCTVLNIAPVSEKAVVAFIISCTSTALNLARPDSPRSSIPSFFKKLSYTTFASSAELGATDDPNTPDIKITLRNSGPDGGGANSICEQIDIDPADSPNNVTFALSPPNPSINF